MNKEVPFFTLKGQTITAIEDGSVIITTTGKYQIIHEQDCCESVTFDRAIGKVENILNSPIILAETDNSPPPWDNKEAQSNRESFTWSSFFLETVNGRLELWFLGESNGYYGETMQFEKIS